MLPFTAWKTTELESAGKKGTYNEYNLEYFSEQQPTEYIFQIARCCDKRSGTLT